MKPKFESMKFTIRATRKGKLIGANGELTALMMWNFSEKELRKLLLIEVGAMYDDMIEVIKNETPKTKRK